VKRVGHSALHSCLMHIPDTRPEPLPKVSVHYCTPQIKAAIQNEIKYSSSPMFGCTWPDLCSWWNLFLWRRMLIFLEENVNYAYAQISLLNCNMYIF